MTMIEARSVIHEIFSLYDRFGQADYIGESVSQIEHMSQSAALAMKADMDDEVILAAFFHDIGHICVMNAEESDTMDGFGNKSHEKIGANFLRLKGFPERIAQLVENHVKAKRYLTFRYPEYFNNLTDASKKTLEYQGGKMNSIEAFSFEQDPLFDASIQLRKWDEEAKEVDAPLVDMALLKTMAFNALATAHDFSRGVNDNEYVENRFNGF